MTDEEHKKLKAEQGRALDISRPAGAAIVHTHLTRKQEVIGVTRDDLEDVLSFDGMAAGFGTLGMFFVSGSSWLIAENTFDQDGFVIDSLMSFCIAALIFGVAALLAAVFMHKRKRGRIKRIFDQTSNSSASTLSNS